MKKFLPYLIVFSFTAFIACNNKHVNTENSIDSTASLSKKDLAEKRWCFASYVLHLNQDQTCKVTRLDDENLVWGPAGQWALRHDTLFIIQKDDKLVHDTAAYKITLTTNSFTARLVKELKDHYSKNYVVPFNDKDDNNNPKGDETTFWLDEEHPSLQEKYITGSWHGEGRINTFDFFADGTCTASGEASQSAGVKVRKGKWKLQNNQIFIVWNELYKPTIQEDENGEAYAKDGEYDSLKINEYDTLNIVRSSRFRLVTKEYGLYIGGTDKDFLKSYGY